MHTIERFGSIVDEIRRNMRSLCVGDRIIAFCVQQHLVQASQNTVRLQQLHALCFDALLVADDCNRPIC